jgi:hypothetical protein
VFYGTLPYSWAKESFVVLALPLSFSSVNWPVWLIRVYWLGLHIGLASLLTSSITVFLLTCSLYLASHWFR